MDGGRLAVLIAAVLGAPATAAAQAFPAVTDRDFTIDLYSGTALGSLRTVGMGGAAVAIAEGSAGALANPAAPAVRAETSRGRWDWDWHFDYLSPGIGADTDNNGIAEDTAYGPLRGPVVTVGGVVHSPWWRRISLGASLTVASHPTAGAEPSTVITPTATVGRVALAVELLGGDLALGAGVRGGTLELDKTVGEDAATKVFSLGGAALEAGALWRPRDRDLRLGATASLPVTGEEVTTDGCDPLDCDGFVIPERVAVPWQIALGAALRRAPTAWNRTIAGRWRDERYWLVALDAVLTGRTPDGHGLEAYSRGLLQRSGRHAVVSVRGGVEHEWRPGRLRVRAGSYWEPARFDDAAGAAIAGRLHLTVGIDVRVWQFCFWRERYRLRLSVTGDAAARYGNGGLSLGLWH